MVQADINSGQPVDVMDDNLEFVRNDGELPHPTALATAYIGEVTSRVG
jgi:hypothetical protein